MLIEPPGGCLNIRIKNLSHRSPKSQIIDNWSIGSFFGQLAVRGVVNGEQRVTALLWISHGNFGVGDWKQQEQFHIGRAAPDAWGLA